MLRGFGILRPIPVLVFLFTPTISKVTPRINFGNFDMFLHSIVLFQDILADYKWTFDLVSWPLNY